MKKELPKSIEFVRGVGPRYARLLQKLDIYTIEDLLYYFPRDYQDRSKLVEIRHIVPGELVTIKGEVIKITEERPRRGLNILKVTFSDGTDVINGVWFNQSYLKKQFQKGKSFFLSGELNEKSWRFRKKEIFNPGYEEIDNTDTIHTGRVVPIYGLTSGMTQKRLREIIYNALKDFSCHFTDILPVEIKKKYGFLDLDRSLWGLHFPESREHFIYARARLAFEELFVLQLLVLNRKKGVLSKKGIQHKPCEKQIKEFLESLSFELTDAQKRVWQEIKGDMEKAAPMQRLLQGDVGSGKTVIAALALLETIANGYQGIIMAPTEILAEQHYLKLKDMFAKTAYRVCLLIGSMSQSERKGVLSAISEKKVDLIVGTHTLFQEGIEYYKPGLIVIDEQHRFGVEQRYRLKEKGENPDLLVMTATPIPRTLSLTVYGDLDLSIVDELPPGRSPVITTWRDEESRGKIYNFVKEKLKEGRQAYIVCPLIEPSEEVKAVSAMELFEKLTDSVFKEFRVGLLHSKVSTDEKKMVMDQFRDGELNILVSTTVVEVGVDVPNATIMIIENAERFGLAQLHQLRGRVGRGEHQSYCIMIANPTTEEGRKRLTVMTETTDGFRIAEEDLLIRGPGEFFGTKQSGMPDLKVANILKDHKLIQIARKEAESIIEGTDEWQEKYPLLYEKINLIELKV